MKLKSIIVGIISLIITSCAVDNGTKVSNQLTSPYITAHEHQHQDDVALQQKLQSILNKAVPSNSIYVAVNNKNILLVGQVINNNARKIAEKIIRNTIVVNKIHNYLTLSTNPHLNLNQSIKDCAQQRLNSQNNIDSSTIDIIVVDNKVYLLGTQMGDMSDLTTAIQGIQAISNVSEVINLVVNNDN